jgi:hypothetical protein
VAFNLSNYQGARCRKSHLLSRIWAWLDSNDPKAVANAIPSAAPVVQNWTPNTVRGAFGFGGRAWYGGQKIGGGQKRKAVIRY